MDIYRRIADIPTVPDSVVTIGTFDGLHRGHQEIVKKVITVAHSLKTKAVLITFDPHPRHVLDQGSKLPMLMTIEKKLEFLESLSLDMVIVIPFTEEFSRLPAEAFISDIIVEKLHPRHLIVGYDHHFGHNREGSPEFLTRLARTHNFTLEVVKPFRDANIAISSTHIRELIKAGYIRRASFELGWVYGFKAKVVTGAGRGMSLSFPTANFVPEDENQLCPSNGVYLTRGRINGNNLYGMCNLGVRPTFGEKDFVMEVHFFDANLKDLQGQVITVEFLERIRDEIKFPSKEQLIKQLKQDREICMQLLKKYN
ncbi:MAG: bifunctional riboflavin kinase/FAD synthetase [Fidelibacterota bacterium]